MLSLGLFLSMILAVTFGAAKLSAYDVYRIIIYKIFHISIGDIDGLINSTAYDIVWLIRFPRVLLGAIVGMSLAVIGVVMQATVQNPLADPYILGLSSGASLGATFAILIGFNGILAGMGITFGAFMGALISSIVVFLLSNLGGRITSNKLILSGMIVSSICSSFTSFIIYMVDNAEKMKSVSFWLMGSLVSASWDNIKVPCIIVLIVIIYFFFQFRVLNTMLLGDNTGITLGIDITKYRKIYMIICSLVTGILVSICGTIGFVGLIIPHIVRMIVGADHKKLIPITALVGAIFLIWTDVFSRTIMNNVEIPIGILTSMLGAPCLMWLMINKAYKTGGQ
ncbi:iron chelate uptake ABC transporter family permease subunit [Clostridium tarantellae]|uniref:Iron chelate uptake ABC transporter family permease subunit n=2 Tax=Clostridium tarantellae TaxID=39493 RepID=A0A6I1MKD9_9CLOT|nr:iron chelate uptake ABC transporter family permease subunit [Clostridium tarantellae]MPQ43996.1 iron chelate uptake ABC transporter family permease subunit [Clostridium tarantellae]